MFTYTEDEEIREIRLRTEQEIKMKEEEIQVKKELDKVNINHIDICTKNRRAKEKAKRI